MSKAKSSGPVMTPVEMIIAYLAGSTGDAAAELQRKLDNLTEEERQLLIAYLSTPPAVEQ